MYILNVYYFGVWPVPGCTISVGGLAGGSAVIELDMEEPMM